jgi:hypothetical protein
MDSGPSIKSNNNDKTKVSNNKSDARDVFQSLWFRRYPDNANEINGFLLWSQFNFILPCGILLWVILLLFG